MSDFSLFPYNKKTLIGRLCNDNGDAIEAAED